MRRACEGGAARVTNGELSHVALAHRDRTDPAESRSASGPKRTWDQWDWQNDALCNTSRRSSGLLRPCAQDLAHFIQGTRHDPYVRCPRRGRVIEATILPTA